MPMVKAADIQLEYFEHGTGKSCFVLVVSGDSADVVPLGMTLPIYQKLPEGK